MLSWLPGAILTAIGLAFVAIKLFKVDLARKNLGYQVTLFRSVLTGGGSVQRNLELRFNGELISDPHLLLVEIRNTGRLPIKADDYEEPLMIILHERSRVLTAQVAQASNKSLAHAFGQVTYEGNRVLIPKRLLNAKDSFSVEILAQQHPGTAEVFGRITGVSNIKEFSDERNSLRWGLVSGSAMIFGVFSWFLLSVPREFAVKAVTPALYVILGVVMLVTTAIVRVVQVARLPKPPAPEQNH